MNWPENFGSAILLSVCVSYLSVWLDQRWHAAREFKAAYARTRSLGRASTRMPEKVTLDALFTSALSELKYRSEQAGKDFEDVLVQLEGDVPGKEFRFL